MPEELPSPSFYTLKEAARELNSYFRTDKIKANFIINLAIAYDVNLYVYFKDWDASADLNLDFPFNTMELPDEKEKLFRPKYRELQLELEEYIRKTTDLVGCLLRLRKEDLILLKYKKSLVLENFDGIMELSEGFLEERRNFLDRFLKYINLPLKEILISTEILRIYPYLTQENDTDEFRLKSCTPKPTSIPEIETTYFPCVTKKNLLITKFELDKIKFGNLIISSVELNSPTTEHKHKRPTGVSLSKRAAQQAAKTLAAYLWRQDKEQKIKIRDMAVTVRAELYLTEHADQLPEKADTLKEWIKDVAPEYARTAGRPSDK